MPICSVEGCDTKSRRHGLCTKHFARKKKGQSMTEKSVYEQTDMERFLAKVTPQENGCWYWKYKRYDGRSNTFYMDGRPQSAYRSAYRLFKGPIAEGLCVCHTCDNGLCVNPDHLWLGTHAENSRDMTEKGRGRPPEGLRNPHARLNPDIVREIRASNETGTQLAKKYGVSKAIVYDVIHGRSWRSVS